MAGGLLQIIVSGQQDIYLTIDPQITFFKKVYRRYTHFSLELRETLPEESPEYDDKVSFIIGNGDALARCYIEVELPKLSFSDKYITNQNYIEKKNSDLYNLNQTLKKWTSLYSNLKLYVDVVSVLYRNLYNFLQSENVTLTILKEEVIRFNYKNKSSLDVYKNSIDEYVLTLIDIASYINSITKLVTNDTTYDTAKYIHRSEILVKINSIYDIMIDYLKFYNNKIVQTNKKISDTSSDNQINFNFAEHLGHNFFDYFTLEIGGLEIMKYSKDLLHINQTHFVDDKDNYYDMIGHKPKLNTFSPTAKGGSKIIVPLIFWFNRTPGLSLPLVAMQNSTVVINAKISNIKKIVCMENYGKMFDDILQVTIDNAIDNTYILNKKLLYNNYTYQLDDKSILYNCKLINNELLKLVFPLLSTAEIDIILTNNGTKLTQNQITKTLYPELTDEEIERKNGLSGEITQYCINRIQWISFMININNTIYSSLASKVGSYYPYINFDLYYSMIPSPIIKLIGEYVYLDDVERGMFAKSKLEYVIEKYNEEEFTIKNLNFFDCEISFNSPCKELSWIIMPRLFLDGITENGQNQSLEYVHDNFLFTKLINKQRITLNQLDLLIPSIDTNFYTYVQAYKYLNNELPPGVNYLSFCLYPEESQPSGTINFREIKSKQYRVDFNKEYLFEYVTLLNLFYKSQQLINNKNSFTIKFMSKEYDMFIVHNGSAKLLFD